MPQVTIIPGQLIGTGVTPSPVLTSSPLEYIVDGAVISEAEDSDSGNVITMQGKEATKRYVCQLPFLDDRPTKYLSKLFPQGNRYPGNQPEYDGLVVFGWDEGERTSSAASVWHSSVLYRGADELATLGWVGEGEFSEEQEHVARDRANVFVTDPVTGARTRVGNLIGHSVYVPTEDQQSGIFKCESSQGGILRLKRTGAFKVLGHDRFRGVHRFGMIRVLPSLSWRQVRQTGDRVWNVNRSRFLDYEPGYLAFSNFAWREVFGQIPNQPATQKQYEVRLQFAANPDKWSPTIEVETYADESGFESPVVNQDQGVDVLVTRTIVRYLAIDFVDIFSTLNTSMPR